MSVGGTSKERGMAMERFVLYDKELASINEWQAAIDAQGYSLKLDTSTNFQAHGGFLPARLYGKTTGFEWDHWPAAEFMAGNPDIGFGHDWKFVLAFRWIGDFNEMVAAWMAAA